MMLANFEWLPANEKVDVGQMLLEAIAENGPADQGPKARELWALSRLGARTTVYGPLDRLAPGVAALRWLDALLAMELEPNASTAQALVLLARYTGDRARDIPAAKRAEVARWLRTSAPSGTFPRTA